MGQAKRKALARQVLEKEIMQSEQLKQARLTATLEAINTIKSSVQGTGQIDVNKISNDLKILSEIYGAGISDALSESSIAVA